MLKEECEVDNGEAEGKTGDVRMKRIHRSVLQDESQYLGPAPRASTSDEEEDEVGPEEYISSNSPGEADATRGEAPLPGTGHQECHLQLSVYEGIPYGRVQ